MKIKCADKLNRLPPYVFTVVNKLKIEAYKKNLDVIDLSMGNPDEPTPEHIVDRLCDTVKNHTRTHRYPQAKGMPKFRKAVSEWFQKRFGVSFDPDSEVLALIGSKEGIGHLSMAFLNPNDIALVPDPSYPIYYNGVILANGKVHRVPLLEKNGFLPELDKIPEKVARRAKLLFLNYPNNPTSAVVNDLYFFKEVVRFAKKYGIIVVHDNAYSEITFDGYVAPSFMQVPGARDVGVEFHSFSKSFCMAGWRVGFVVGNRNIVGPLEKFKSFVDYGVSTFIQLAAVMALKGTDECVRKTTDTYRQRRDRFVSELSKIGWNVPLPKATMYIWAKIPEKFRKMGSLEFSVELIRKTGIAVAPGSAYGKYGEGYIRLALVTHINRFHDAALRLKNFFDGRL